MKKLLTTLLLSVSSVTLASEQVFSSLTYVNNEPVSITITKEVKDFKLTLSYESGDVEESFAESGADISSVVINPLKKTLEVLIFSEDYLTDIYYTFDL